MAESASAFTIVELTGDKREFRFTGRGLPYPPFTLSGAQRADVTWYAGSPEATIQMLGAKENETTINGMWKDKFLRHIQSLTPTEQVDAGFTLGALSSGESVVAGQSGTPGALIDGEPINNVRELADEIDDVRRKGQIVEVSWMHIVRRGFLKNFRQSWHLAQELEWEIRFEWINQGTQLADIPIQERSIDMSDTLVEFSNQLDELNSLRDGSTALNLGGSPDLEIPDLSATSLDLRSTAFGQAISDVNSGIDAIQNALLAFQDNIIMNTQTLLSPISTAQRAAAMLDFIKELGKDTANAISNRLDSAILNAPNLPFGTRLDQRNTLHKQRRASLRISSIASIRQEQLLKQIQPELIATFTAREDQDLRDISLQYYGTADEWRSLLRFNDLDTSRLSANQLIFVPRNPPRGDQC